MMVASLGVMTALGILSLSVGPVDVRRIPPHLQSDVFPPLSLLVRLFTRMLPLEPDRMYTS